MVPREFPATTKKMAAAAGEQRSLESAFGRDSGRLGVQLFFEKRCVQSFKLNLSTSVALVGCSAILLRAEGI